MTQSTDSPGERPRGDSPLTKARRGVPKAQTPWEILTLVRPLELPDRPQFLQPFLDLASRLPRAERDAVVLAGREVFRYRVATVHEEIDKRTKEEGGRTVTEVSVITEAWMAELAYRPGTDRPLGYLVYRFADDSIQWVDKLQDGKTTYVPPLSNLIESGTVLLPSGYEEYGTDSDLFAHIQHYLSAWIQLENLSFRTLVATYILMTWVFDRFDALPYLRPQGDFSSGKSRLLQVVGFVCFRPVMATGGATPAALFRIIHKFHPTLVIDEADFSGGDEAHEIIRILLAGYQRGFSVLRAERTASDNFDVASYDCYCPKLVASRRRFADPALESRCLSYTMPLLPDIAKDMPLVLGPEFRSEALRLRNMLLLWRFRNWRTVQVDPTLRIEGGEPRVNQIIQPLIASVPEGPVRSAIVEMAQAYSRDVQSERRESLEGIVAQALLLAWRRTGYADRVLLKDITPVAQEDFPRVGPERVGNIIRRILGFETRRGGGLSWVLTPLPQIRTLAVRYGLSADVPPASPPSGPTS
jgi:hypothetical protein